MDMTVIIPFGFLVGIIWSAVGYLICMSIFTMIVGDAFFDFFNPCWIYAHVRVNIIGCILLTICIHILSPFVAIGYWIYKICTVGRK